MTENKEHFGPKWIINFPSKPHWRVKTRVEWVEDGLCELVRVIKENAIRSVALPSLECGNGGLEWESVRPLIVSTLEDVEGLDATACEPAAIYENIVKPRGVQMLTPVRGLVAEMVRRYRFVGVHCTILEVQAGVVRRRGLETGGPR